MRLIFLLLVFLPALIYGRPMDEEEHTASEDSSESGDGKPMDEDKPSNSKEDQVTTAELSDSSKPKENPSIQTIGPSDFNEDQENEKLLDLGDFIESGEGKPVDEDEPPNSNEDKEKTTDLSDSSKPREGKEKEIGEDEELGRKEDCDGPVMSTISQGLMTEKGCVCGSDGVSCPTWKCNVNFCACKSKDTGKRIDFEC